MGELINNRSITIDEALELIEFDEQAFKSDHGYDKIDYNEFTMEVKQMTYKTIDNFEFDRIAGDFKTVEDVDSFGDRWKHKERTISEGVKLFVYESGHAALEFCKDEGQYLEFLYTDEVEEVFNEFENITAIELFDVLNRNRLTDSQ